MNENDTTEETMEDVLKFIDECTQTENEKKEAEKQKVSDAQASQMRSSQNSAQTTSKQDSRPEAERSDFGNQSNQNEVMTSDVNQAQRSLSSSAPLHMKIGSQFFAKPRILEKAPIKDCYGIGSLIDLDSYTKAMSRKRVRLSDMLGQNVTIKDIASVREYTARVPDQTTGKILNLPGIKFTVINSDGKELEVSTTSKTVMGEIMSVKASVTSNGLTDVLIRCSVIKCDNGRLLLMDAQE